MSKIEWTEEIWNPITGCTKISEGCKNCYAERMAKRLKGRYGYPKDDPFRVTFHPNRLNQPFTWKKPRRIFVCSMSDIFHNDVKNWRIDQIFKRIYYDGISHHTWIILTKRHERMLEYTSRDYISSLLSVMPNIIGMVTAENQKQADIRIPALLKSPFSTKGVSVEPMLGPLDLAGDDGGHHYFPFENEQGTITPGIDWVICGGESGPGARPIHPDWVRGLAGQCFNAGVPFFFKQWGQYAGFYSYPIGSGVLKENGGFLDFNKSLFPWGENNAMIWNVGKKKAGRLLDGREWNQYPLKEV